MLTLATVTISGGLAFAQSDDMHSFDAEADMAIRIEQIEQYNSGPDGLNAIIVHSQTAGFKAREAAGIGPLNGPIMAF